MKTRRSVLTTSTLTGTVGLQVGRPRGGSPGGSGWDPGVCGRVVVFCPWRVPRNETPLSAGRGRHPRPQTPALPRDGPRAPEARGNRRGATFEETEPSSHRGESPAGSSLTSA